VGPEWSISLHGPRSLIRLSDKSGDISARKVATSEGLHDREDGEDYK
jgi:hypothetical protein